MFEPRLLGGRITQCRRRPAAAKTPPSPAHYLVRETKRALQALRPGAPLLCRSRGTTLCRANRIPSGRGDGQSSTPGVRRPTSRSKCAAPLGDEDGDRARADGPPEALRDGDALALEGAALRGRDAPVERRRAQQGVELGGGLLEARKPSRGRCASSKRSFTNRTRPGPATRCSASARSCLPGSSAVTWSPRATRLCVSWPLPQPISSTWSPAPSAATRQA